MAVDMKNLRKFARVYSSLDFTGIGTADVVCQPSQWNKVGYITVSAQTLAQFGSNIAMGGIASGEAAYLRFDDSTATQLHGKVRFAVTNATETETHIVMEQRTNRLSADSSDRTKAVLMPELAPLAKEDSKLIVYFYPDSATAVTIDYNGTNTAMLIPVTLYQ